MFKLSSLGAKSYLRLPKKYPIISIPRKINEYLLRE